MKKRMTSLLLALLMALTLLPVTAWAEETVPADTQPEETPAVMQQADDGAVVYMADAADEADTGIATYVDGDDLAERAKAAGFVTMEMGEPKDWDTPGIFRVNAPLGLVEGTDYTYTYDYENGHLTLKLLPGEVSHWKAALLYCVTSDTLGDTLEFNFSFNRTEDSVYGTMCSSKYAAKRVEEFLNNKYDTLSELEDYMDAYGTYFDVATPKLNSGNTEICVEAGTRDYLCLVVWQNEAGEYTKYYLVVSIDGGEGFRHTVATPVLRDLAADRVTVNSDVNGGLDSWNINTALGQLSLTPTAGNALSALATGNYADWYNIGTFAVTAPGDEYTLQSYYNIDQTKNRRSFNDSPESNGEKRLSLFTRDNMNGGTIRYTLRWANADPTLPDLVEKLNVRVSPRPWGKLTDDGEEDPSIVDVERLFEYLTKEQKPVTGVDRVDPQLAAYDLNYDGYVDVYDIQTLYEYVALGGKTLTE